MPLGSSNYYGGKIANQPQLSVPQMMNIQERGGPQFSNMKDPRTGQWLTLDEAQALGPLYHSGWNTSGVGPGTRGYRGSYYNGGYNYGEGTRRPTASNSSEYYSTRDRVMGNPLDNLRRFGPGRAFGGSLAQKLAAEVRGSAASDPVWGSTMSGGATTLPPSSFGFRESPYGTKIENGVEVPMTAEDLGAATAAAQPQTHTFVPSGFTGPPSQGSPIGSVFSPYGRGSSTFGPPPIFGPPSNLANQETAGPPSAWRNQPFVGPPSGYRTSPFMGPPSPIAPPRMTNRDRIQESVINTASNVGNVISSGVKFARTVTNPYALERVGRSWLNNWLNK